MRLTASQSCLLPLFALAACSAGVDGVESSQPDAPPAAPATTALRPSSPAPAATTKAGVSVTPPVVTKPESYGVSNLWPVATDGTVPVPYVIDATMPAAQQTRVKDAMTYWSTNTFVRPTPRVAEADYIDFKYNGSPTSTTGSSALGRQGGAQTIWIGGNFGGTAHEFGHAMGLIHEQQRPDRDYFVFFNVDPNANGDLRMSFGGNIVGMYDLHSLMHYWSDTAGTNSMVTKTGATISGNDHLTQGDLYGLQELYFPSTGTRGNAFVSLAGSIRSYTSAYLDYFAPERKIDNWFCIDDEDCMSADVDGNGSDDLVTFTKSGPVYVALSDGSGFGAAVMANDWFCIGSEVCALGDVDGDGAQDIVTFQHGSTNRAVYVGQSSGVYHRAAPDSIPMTFWSRLVLDDFCGEYDQCLVGDVTGDGRADLLSVKMNGEVRVSTSYPSGFGFAFTTPTLVGTINRAAMGWVPFTAKLTHFDWYNGALDLALVTSSNGVWTVSTRPNLSAYALANPTRVADTNAWSRYDFATLTLPRSTEDLVEYTNDGRILVRTVTAGTYASFADPWASGISPECASFTHGCVFGDLNGDGSKDLVRFGR